MCLKACLYLSASMLVYHTHFVFFFWLPPSLVPLTPFNTFNILFLLCLFILLKDARGIVSVFGMVGYCVFVRTLIYKHKITQSHDDPLLETPGHSCSYLISQSCCSSAMLYLEVFYHQKLIFIH